MVPDELTAYIKDRHGYDYSHHGRADNPDTDFVPDEIVDRFCILGPPRPTSPSSDTSGTSASTSSPSTTCTTSGRAPATPTDLTSSPPPSLDAALPRLRHQRSTRATRSTTRYSTTSESEPRVLLPQSVLDRCPHCGHGSSDRQRREAGTAASGLRVAVPGPSLAVQGRRRIGAAPLRRLFEILVGPVAHLGQAGSLWTGRQAPPRAAEGIGD